MSDSISRQAAIRWVKTECNPYGKPTLDFESGKKVIEHLEQMPSAQPQRKTGRWIHDGSKWANRWICDRCKYKLFGVKTKFCPDCGAKMEVEHGE